MNWFNRKIINNVNAKGNLHIAASHIAYSYNNGLLTDESLTDAHYRILIATALAEPSPLQKIEDNAHSWEMDDLNPEQKKNIYDYTKKSYEKGETGEAFTEDIFWKKVRNGPWTFYGDKAMTGYVTVRELWEIPGMVKLTGSGGSPRGMMAGMAKLLKENKAVFGAVTPKIFQMAMKYGFKTLDPMTLKIFVKMAPEEVWGYGGKPSMSSDGKFQIYMPQLGKTVEKQFICNDKFMQWVESQKSKYMGKMGNF